MLEICPVAAVALPAELSFDGFLLEVINSSFLQQMIEHSGQSGSNGDSFFRASFMVTPFASTTTSPDSVASETLPRCPMVCWQVFACICSTFRDEGEVEGGGAKHTNTFDSLGKTLRDGETVFVLGDPAGQHPRQTPVTAVTRLR
jgi:hypothetical protein